MNFEKYIGIPYKDGGREIDGLDCWGLVRLFYKDEMGIILPSLKDSYCVEDTLRLEELVHQYREGWEPCDPHTGALVLLKILGSPTHVGVMVDNTKFLHIREGRDSVIEDITNSKWKTRVVGFFKYSEGAVLNSVPHPLKTERYLDHIAVGTTVSELVDNIKSKYNISPQLKTKINITLNGVPLQEEVWNTTKITPGDVLEYRAVPGREVARAALMIAVLYVATQTGLAAAGLESVGALSTASAAQAATYYAVSTTVMIAGSYLVNSIAPIRPPSEPKDPGSPERQFMVEGGNNSYNPYGSIPVILGKVRVTPPLGSVNYLTYENERDSYISMLLVWGYGPLYLHPNTYKIGDIILNQDNFKNWYIQDDFRISELTATESTNFKRLYGSDVVQVNLQQELVCDGNPESVVSPGPWAQASTNIEYDPSTNTISPVLSATIALHFPQGLRRIVTKGRAAGESEAVGVTFRVESSINSGVTWTYLDSFTLGSDAPKRDAFTWTKTYNLNVNEIALRIRRETGDNTEDNDNYRYYFTSVIQNVTFIRNLTPAQDPVGAKIAKTAFKIKATDQVSGTLQGISAIVQTWCLTWNGTNWVEGATSNPAALMRYVLEHPANPRKVTNAATQINLQSLQYFYSYCQAKGFEYNGILGQSKSILEVLRDICAAGRASPALIDGKWSVIIDEPRTVTVQHFTPYNSWGFEGTKALPKKPDGLRVTYYDEDKNYQESEIIVYDLGKSATTASLFESISLPGVTKSSLVTDHCRWHMAQIKLRPEIYTLNCDIEYLVCNRGDRVKVTHDIPMWGLGSGRVKNRLSNTRLELDEEMPLQANKNYTIRFRTKTGNSVTRTVVAQTQDGYYDIIDLTTAVTTSEADVDDLFMFGELNQESQDLIVLSIEPSTNNTARLTLVDYGVTSTYNIFTDYTFLSTSTVFQSNITLPPTLQINSFGTKVPDITGFVSDESVMERVSKGVYKYKINVAYFNALELPINTELVEFEYKLNSSTTNVNTRTVRVPFMSGSCNLTDVNEGETYSIRARYISEDGRPGNWSLYKLHTVVGKVALPSTVTGLTVGADRTSGQLLISWQDNPEPDVFTYEVRKQNSNWGISDSNRVFYGDAVKVFTLFPDGVTTYYVKAIDTSDNYSLLAASATYTPQAVPNITYLNYTYADTSLTNATVLLEWNSVETSEFGVDYYEIIYDSITKQTKSTNITLPANWVGDRTFTIKTVDVHSNRSSGFVTTITKLAPTSPQSVKAQVIDNNVMLFWSLPNRTSLPIDHVLIKKGSSWNTATVLGEKKGEFTSINEVKGGDYTYWLACVDTEGIQSVPVAINTTVSEPPDFIFNGEFLSTFTGTKVGCSFDDIQLVMPVNITETFESHFTTRSWTSPQDQVTAGYPIFIQPSTSSGYYEEVFDFQQPLSSSRVTLNYVGTAISGTPTVKETISVSLNGSSYTDYPGVTQIFASNFRYVKIKIEVINNSTPQTDLYSVKGLGVVLDAKLKDDVGTVNSLNTDANGTIVNFGKEFIDVQSITLAPATTVPVYAVYDIKDNFVTGTYTVTSNVCTISYNNHGFITGQKVKLFINSGSGIQGVYTITSYTTNTFTVNMITTNTSGSISLYPQSFRVYLFDNTGTRATGNLSWAVRGY